LTRFQLIKLNDFSGICYTRKPGASTVLPTYDLSNFLADLHKFKKLRFVPLYRTNEDLVSMDLEIPQKKKQEKETRITNFPEILYIM
jgi:hypothetical protein